MTDESLPDLMDAKVQQSPYPLYERLQAQCPVYKMPSTGFHLVVSDQHASEALRQPDLFLSGVNPTRWHDARPGTRAQHRLHETWTSD